MTVPSSATRIGPVPVATSRNAGSPIAAMSTWAITVCSEVAPAVICWPPSLTSTAPQRPSGSVMIASISLLLESR